MTVSEYNEAEKKALAYIPNRIIESCAPVAFNHVGYPHRVETDQELYRYVDCMHETRTTDIIDNLLGGLTDEEFESFKFINDKVMDLTLNKYGKKTFATASLLRAVNVFRHIRFLYPNGGQILEIGAGCGYLGALLMHFRYSYICTDVSQAFYCYQSNLLQKIRIFMDMVFNHEDLRPNENLHIPWWRFYVQNPQFSFRPDVITCNHCLCEMHPWALLYLLKLSKQILDGYFIFEGYGSHIKCNEDECERYFKENGFLLNFKDLKISVFSKEKQELGDKIKSGREQLKTEKKFEEIMSYICALIPEKMGMSDDEHFLNYIGKNI